MKNNLNEQLSRIKNMMGMISEQSFITSPSGQKYDMPVEPKPEPVTKFSGNKPVYERVFFNNGGDISIQASRTAYSQPRDNEGPYTHMELGYPSEGTVLPKNVLKYVEQGGVYNDDGSENPYKNVYPYVPVSVIKELINANGGIKSGQLPPMSDEPMEDDPFVRHGKDDEEDDYESSVENDDYDEKQERNYGVEDLNEMGEYETPPNLVACSGLGIKYAGLCDKVTKKPVVECAKLGVKSIGYCFVDTKQPVNVATPKGQDINELGGYIGDAPEKISGPKIEKIDPRIHEGYSGYDVLRAQKLLLNIYAYGDINIKTEDYLKLSNYMKEIYKSVKYDEDWKNTHGESPDGEPNKEETEF